MKTRLGKLRSYIYKIHLEIKCRTHETSNSPKSNRFHTVSVLNSSVWWPMLLTLLHSWMVMYVGTREASLRRLDPTLSHLKEGIWERKCVRNSEEADGHRSRRQQRLGNYVEFINELSAWNNLVFTGKLYGMPKTSRESRAEELLKMFGL